MSLYNIILIKTQMVEEDATKDIAKGAAIGAATTGGTALGLTAAGFTGSGVAAGSVAAGIQAGIGNVAAGSLFATCQSVAATGLLFTALPVVAGIGAVTGLGYFLYKKHHRHNQ